MGVTFDGTAVEAVGEAGGVVGSTGGVGIGVAVATGGLVGSGDGIGEGTEVLITSTVAVGAAGVGAWAASLPQPLIKSAAMSSEPAAAR